MAEAKESYLNVELYEKSEGKLGKKTEFSIKSEPKPLQDILKSYLTTEWPDVDLQSVKCYSGNISGENINLDCQPHEVPYITDTLRNQETPTVIVLRESTSYSPPPLSPGAPQQVSRTLSNFLRGMIGNMSDPSPLPWRLPSFSNSLEEEDSENIPTMTTPPISVQGPSGSSNESSPEKVRRFKQFNKNSRSISLKETHTLGRVSGISDEVFEEDSTTPPLRRPRGQVLNTRNRKTSRDMIDKIKKRNTLISFTHDSEDLMDITSPEASHSHDWKKRQNRDVRTTRRGNHNRPKKKQEQMPTLSYSSFEVHNITVQPDEYPSFTVKCREFETVGALKQMIQKELRRKSLIFSSSAPSFKVDFTLTYKLEGTTYELFNDRQLIFKTRLYSHWKELGDTCTVPVCVGLVESSWEIPTLLRFSKLTGVMLDECVSQFNTSVTGLAQIAKNDRTEVEWARRTLHSYVDELVRNRDGNSYALSMELETEGTSTLLALQTPIDNKVEITFHYKTVFSLQRRISVNERVCNILNDVFPCLVACGLVENDINKYTLQVTGEMSYLDGQNELIAFKDIRRSILKSQPIHISVSRKPQPSEDEVCALNWLPIDQLSAVPPLHTDISRSQKRESGYETFAASVWDQNDELATLSKYSFVM